MTLVITDEDIELFDKLAELQFIKELNQYYILSSPYRIKIMIDTDSFKEIEWFIDKIKALGLEKRASYYLFLDISLLLGSLFDQDALYQSLMIEFNNNSYLAEAERIDYFYQSISNYMQNVVGENKKLLKKAVEELGQLEVLRMKEDNFDSDMFMVLKRFYPEKIANIELEYCHHFIEWGKTYAQNNYDLTNSNHWATYIILMFYLGQHFDEDPFLTWFDWTSRLDEIRQNQFSFKLLSEQLMMIWNLNEKEENNHVNYS